MSHSAPSRQPSPSTHSSGKPGDTPLRKLGHDMSGPLTSILINCEMVLEEDCSAEVRRRVETILAAAMQINRLLHQSRIEEAA